MNKARILIVEDDALTAEQEEQKLLGLGYEVAGKAATGTDAVRMVDETRPDLVLMDIRLRGKMDGIEAASLIVQQHDVPILYVTAYADDNTLQRAKITAPFAYILKPFNTESLCSNIEMSLYKHSLDQQLRQSLHGIIDAFVSLTEVHSPSIAQHQQQAAQLANAIAKEMGLARNEITSCRVGALLHAVGLMGISFETLNKPGALSKVETIYFQSYPEIGYEILKNINFPWPVADIVRQHRERLDGSGYPNGLKGDQILPEAHIVIVACQVVTSVKGYSLEKTGNLEEVLAEIEKGSGTLFDPEAVDVCLKLFREKGFRLGV